MVKGNFPDDYVDPKLKGRDWLLQYAKAAWEEWGVSGHSIFYAGRDRYREVTEYLMAMQRIDQYEPVGTDGNVRENWNKIDWRVLSLVSKPVRICMGLLNKQAYKVGFVPVDALAKDEKNTYFSDIKTKMLLREQIMASDPENGPVLIKQLGLERLSDEPGDQEELEMKSKYTYKHISALQMEEDTSVVFTMNKIDDKRKDVRFDLFAHGVGGFRDYIDSNGALKIRKVKPANIVVSPCSEKDFSDARYIGEVVDMTLAQYAQADQTASKDFLVELANKQGEHMGVRYFSWEEAQNHKIQVLDLEISTYDDTYYISRKNSYGNAKFAKVGYGREDADVKRLNVWYKCKFVIGTDHIFDFGLCTDMKRAKSSLADAKSNFHLYAPDFHDMKIKSIGEQLLPILDQIQLDWGRWQKFKSNAKGVGIDMEIGALEDVNFGRGGQKMSPRELYELYEDKWTVMWRRKDRGGKDSNWRPINALSHGNMVQEAMLWYDAIQANIQMLKDIIGLNDFTDASTPDPRSLTTTAELAAVATTNSLYGLINADVMLVKSLAESVVIRLQDMESMGMLDRYALSMGNSSISFIKNNPKVSPYQFAIDIRELPGPEEKARLVETAKGLFGGGMVGFDDVVMIENTDDLRQAQVILAYKIEKRRKEQLQETMMANAHNSQLQAQAGVVAEQEKYKTVEMEVNGRIKVAEIAAKADLDVALVNAGKSLDVEDKKQSQIATAV